MNGSEKQIKWAEEIKAAAIARTDTESVFAAVENQAVAFGDDINAHLAITEAPTEEQIAAWASEEAEKHQDARWWIERRNASLDFTSEVAARFFK